MSFKSMEIYYDIASIPGLSEDADMGKALDFRSAAMEHIEEALEAAGCLEEW